MRELVDQFDETTNLMIRTGTTVRFIASVEGTQVLRVGNRAGMVFPAHKLSGGLLMLAELDDAAIRALYEKANEDAGEGRGGDPGERVDVEALIERVRQVRQQGFALNSEQSERGVLAVGHAVRDAEGQAIAAVAVSMPVSRFEPVLLRPLVGALRLACRAIERDLATAS